MYVVIIGIGAGVCQGQIVVSVFEAEGGVGITVVTELVAEALEFPVAKPIEPEDKDKPIPVATEVPNTVPIVSIVDFPIAITIELPEEAPIEPSSGEYPKAVEVPIEEPTAIAKDWPIAITVEVPEEKPISLVEICPIAEIIEVPVAEPIALVEA